MPPSFAIFINSILSAALTSLAMTYINTGQIEWSAWSANWFITWLIVANYLMFVAPWINRAFSDRR